MEKNMESRAYARLAALFDDGAFTEINAAVKEAEDAAGVVCAYGYVNGNAVYAFSQDKTVNNGAVGLQQRSQSCTDWLPRPVPPLWVFTIPTAPLSTVQWIP